MMLLASAFFLTLLQCSNAQGKTSITPADCTTIEKDAGEALDLVNKHRRDGYVFGLFRVADAHELHIGNSSVLYLTLDVLETECSVLSNKHWESCEHSDLYSMDFGQCKIIIYRSQLLNKPQLHGFNCTLSPVPPDLLECKDCPVKIEILEVIEQHKNIAEKALQKFNSQVNHTNYFKVDKVEKILKMTASHEGYLLGFSIKETNCSRPTQEEHQTLECDFLDDWHAHMGFCKARIITDAEQPEGTDINCEIYHPWQLNHWRRCRYPGLGHPHRHPHCHHHFGHGHRHKHHHKHGSPPPSQSEDPENNHRFNEEHKDSHEGSAPPHPHKRLHHHLHHRHHCPPPPPHCRPHHHLHPPSDDDSHPPPHEEQQDPPSGPSPHDVPHHHLQQESQDPPSAHTPHEEAHNLPHGSHHGPDCPPPPPHGPHHHHPPPHCGPDCPPPPPHGPHHHHPPPHCGPDCPPPPPHGPHHHHPPPHCGPDCPPPPPHGPHHHHPPPHCGPHHHHPPGHPHRHHHNKTSKSGKYFPFQVTGALYRIPVLNQQDSLTPPTANFPELFQTDFHSSSTGEGIPFTGSNLKEMPEGLGFPDHPTQSKSCPGNPKLVLPKILPLFPHSSKAEKSLS